MYHQDDLTGAHGQDMYSYPLDECTSQLSFHRWGHKNRKWLHIIRYNEKRFANLSFLSGCYI